MEPVSQISSYLYEVFDDLNRLTEIVGGLLKGVEYDTLVGTGLSSTLVLAHLAHEFKKYFLVVRKDGDSTHALYRTEGRLGERWVFVDDTISSGSTEHRVVRAVRDVNVAAKYIGAVLYHDRVFKGAE